MPAARDAPDEVPRSLRVVAPERCPPTFGGVDVYSKRRGDKYGKTWGTCRMSESGGDVCRQHGTGTTGVAGFR